MVKSGSKKFGDFFGRIHKSVHFDNSRYMCFNFYHFKCTGISGNTENWLWNKCLLRNLPFLILINQISYSHWRVNFLTRILG